MYCFFLGLFATTLGRIASYYYLSHETLKHFKDALSADMTIEDVLQVKVQQRSSDHFKDLYKLYFLMVVCFKARATCHYCPSCLKIL